MTDATHKRIAYLEHLIALHREMQRRETALAEDAEVVARNAYDDADARWAERMGETLRRHVREHEAEIRHLQGEIKLSKPHEHWMQD